MEEKKNKKKNIIIGILLGIVICLVIALVFISYNKFNEEDKKCKNDNNNINNTSNYEEENKNDNEIYKFVNAEDKESYISFDTTNRTWTHIRNMCEGYEKINGTYYIENNKIILKSDSFTDSYSSTRGAIVTFTLINDDFNHVEKILYTIEGDFNYVGCSGSNYFIAEK